VISHYPSRAPRKGSDEINYVIEHMVKDRDFIFKYISKRIPWKDNLIRMSECDIYIEHLFDDRFGITALLAAALGKIVVTKFPYMAEYEKIFGVPAVIQAANTKEELADRLDYLLSLSDAERLELKKRTRKWVEEVHSHEVVGKRLVKVYQEVLDGKSNSTT